MQAAHTPLRIMGKWYSDESFPRTHLRPCSHIAGILKVKCFQLKYSQDVSSQSSQIANPETLTADVQMYVQCDSKSKCNIFLANLRFQPVLNSPMRHNISKLLFETKDIFMF